MEIKRVGRRDSSQRKKTGTRVNLKHSVFFSTLQEYEAKKVEEAWRILSPRWMKQRKTC